MQLLFWFMHLLRPPKTLISLVTVLVRQMLISNTENGETKERGEFWYGAPWGKMSVYIQPSTKKLLSTHFVERLFCWRADVLGMSTLDEMEPNCVVGTPLSVFTKACCRVLHYSVNGRDFGIGEIPIEKWRKSDLSGEPWVLVLKKT